MNGHSGPKVVILYQISNVKGEGQSYNAFELPGTNGGVSLATVKQSCHALRHLSASGADGYHWRVRVDDKTNSSSGSAKSAPKYSWWDVQDEAARLPIQQVGFSELQHMLSVSKSAGGSSSSDSGHHSSKGVVRSIGKAMNKVAASVEGAASSSTFDNGPRVPILMFKLLDLGKLHNEHHSGRAPAMSSSAHYVKTNNTSTNNVNNVPPRQQQQQQHSTVRSRTPTEPPATRRQPPAPTQQRPAASRPLPTPNQPNVAVGSLMDFGPGPTKTTHHTHSAPPSFGQSTPIPAAPRPPSNETRAEKLKREYEEKKNTENRVWDEVDQRWVTVDTANGATVSRGSTSAPPGVVDNGESSNSSNIKGISLDSVNTAGKSAHVAAAVHSRVSEMKESQAKAVAQIREREQAKKMNEAEEDTVRQKLEPMIKAWSEEHGKKKQLRALLANLHTILWPEANWKQVNLGDLLDDKKCKLAFHKASRVVHPDKTIHLPTEQRFLAKRIFDALSQAKTEFDNK